MASASDQQVLAKAATEGLTLITADRGDFGRELALTRAVNRRWSSCGSFPMSSVPQTSPPSFSPT